VVFQNGICFCFVVAIQALLPCYIPMLSSCVSIQTTLGRKLLQTVSTLVGNTLVYSFFMLLQQTWSFSLDIALITIKSYFLMINSLMLIKNTSYTVGLVTLVTLKFSIYVWFNFFLALHLFHGLSLCVLTFRICLLICHTWYNGIFHYHAFSFCVH